MITRISNFIMAVQKVELRSSRSIKDRNKNIFVAQFIFLYTLVRTTAGKELVPFCVTLKAKKTGKR